MIEESGVHGFAHGIIAAEREGNIRYPAAYFGIRQVFFDPSGGVDKINGIVVMLFQTGSNR
ncbi:hypothetical protein D9M68_656440 [compost metagenome]